MASPWETFQSHRVMTDWTNWQWLSGTLVRCQSFSGHIYCHTAIGCDTGLVRMLVLRVKCIAKLSYSLVRKTDGK